MKVQIFKAIEDIKAKHGWFFDRYVKRYEKDNERNAEIDQEVNPVQLDENMEQEEQDGLGESEETISFAYFDRAKEIASLNLVLKKKSGLCFRS